MANLSQQLEQIKTLLSSSFCSSSSSPKSSKPLAYSSLLQLQEHSVEESSLINSLAAASRSLVSLISSDIADDDEEIATQALKCLGFMIYHPALVAAISENDINHVLDSLTKVIMTTKMKSVCNLGVWCISIQQIDVLYLAADFDSLLRAIVHAIDNPIGSLSTTFEAIQALMKITTQLKEKMIETASIWAPPIYRRLLSTDKRVRDMSERCLLKIKPMICPPPLTLSKALVIDMKNRLLPGIRELQSHGLKIQAIQAWGWYIRLLGPYAKKNRHLVNEMLKFPEQTFSDVDSQVQIASLVAWEGLIDAYIQPTTDMDDQNRTFATEGEGNFKSVKLIMTPLIGILSSKCDVSVHSSCLNAWCYLLHKLGASVNCLSIMKLAFEAILDAVFQLKLESKNILAWNFCLDLLEEFILTNIRDAGNNLNHETTTQLSTKHYTVEWLPWSFDKLEFFMKMICKLIEQGSMDAALRIFRSVLKGVRIMLKSSTVSYDEVMSSLSKILGLVKEIYEESILGNRDINDLYTALHFIGAVIEELEPSILGSPLYKVALDLKCLDKLLIIDESVQEEVFGLKFPAYMEMVSPVVYLTLVYLGGVLSSKFSIISTEFIYQDARKFIKNVLSSFEPFEILNATICLLYKHKEFSSLKIWMAIANGLKDYLSEVKDVLCFNTDPKSPYCLMMCHLLCYPFWIYSRPQKQVSVIQATKLEDLSTVSLRSQRKIELDHVAEVWKSFYGCVNGCLKSQVSASNRFAHNLSVTLNGFFDSKSKVVESSTKLNESNNFQDHDFVCLSGNVVTSILEYIYDEDEDPSSSCGISSVFGFVASFMKLSLVILEKCPPADLSVVSRFFSVLAEFVGLLKSNELILSFLQVISDPLVQWLSSLKILCKHLNHQLELLWSNTLNSLQTSNPPIIFDSILLNNQSRLFETALNHRNPSIFKPAFSFWNSTFAFEAKLEFPQSLVPTLDKLSREGKIEIRKRNFSLITRCNSYTVPVPRFNVTSINNMSSKRVEFIGNKDKDKHGSKGKRRRRELTEHQKEVRRAQQGKERDCGGHGPGIRTYTGVDFSQGNDESQDSQDIELRDVEAILQKLKRDS